MIIKMNIKLLEYLKRYNFTPNPYTTFFTNLNKDEFLQEVPYLIDIEHFNNRLIEAKTKNHKICIYSDYDADAITATAVMYHGLISLGYDPQNLSYYAPDRFTEGYGINQKAIKNLAEKNDLIISVDCGINSTKEANICLESNCDLIITDHHVLSGSIPQALAVINPRLTLDYQNNYLNRKMRESTFEKYFPKQKFVINIHKEWVSPSVCGVGVAWFSLLHLAHALDVDLKVLNLLLPFVAIGTIADCQSILDNQNRILVKAGLKTFLPACYSYPGLRELVLQSKTMEKITLGVLSSQDLGFTIAPILNAAGRIDHAHLAIKLLCSLDNEIVEDYTSEIIRINGLRKEMVKQAIEDSALFDFEKNSLVFMITDYSKGIVGLIASRMVEKYHKMAVVIAKDQNDQSPESLASASLRAPEGYNLVDIMKNINPKLLLKFGGHPQAGGFSCYAKDCEKIKEEFESILEHYKPQQQAKIDYIPQDLALQEFNKRPTIYLDSQDINNSLFDDVSQLEPFGQDFNIPKFLIKITSYQVVVIGKLQNHLKIHLKNISIMYFNTPEEDKSKLLQNTEVFVLVRLSKNIYKDIITNQLSVEKLVFKQ